MSDEIITSSPPKKRFKQLNIMDSMSKASGSVKLNSSSVEICTDHVTLEIESEEDLIVSNSQVVAVVEQVKLTAIEEKITSNSFEEVLTVEKNINLSWKGKSISTMQHLNSINSADLPKIIPARNQHAVLFQVPIHSGNPMLLPHPSKYNDKWDAEHVKMPCSPNNLYPINTRNGSVLEQRWILIQEAFTQSIQSSLDLERAILTYNSRYNGIWEFKGLHSFVTEILTVSERERFFSFTLPGIINLALRVQEIVTRPPTLLTRQKSSSVSLTQLQIASLLANAFLNTFPRRNTQKKQSEFSNYPDINFIRLFENKSCWVYEKLKCILNYFDRVIAQEPNGVLTFTRQVLSNSDFDWEDCRDSLLGFHVSSEGTIESEGTGLLQMDFANKFIGGGVLNWGCVQEEIRFVICPELIVSCLFTEVMENNEALIITGCEQYCKYSGYSDTFRFEGDYIDSTPRDEYGRRMCQVVAIDAIPFRRKQIQYQREFILRELNKAYAGFHCPQRSVAPLAAIATGNWGCGAFGGDPRLKCLLQLMVAAVTGRDIAYFTFGDLKLRDDVYNMYCFLKEKNVSVGSLYKMLSEYGEKYGESQSLDLYGYLYAFLDNIDSDGVINSSSELSECAEPMDEEANAAKN